MNFHRYKSERLSFVILGLITAVAFADLVQATKNVPRIETDRRRLIQSEILHRLPNDTKSTVADNFGLRNLGGRW